MNRSTIHRVRKLAILFLKATKDFQEIKSAKRGESGRLTYVIERRIYGKSSIRTRELVHAFSGDERTGKTLEVNTYMLHLGWTPILGKTRKSDIVGWTRPEQGEVVG